MASQADIKRISLSGTFHDQKHANNYHSLSGGGKVMATSVHTLSVTYTGITTGSNQDQTATVPMAAVGDIVTVAAYSATMTAGLVPFAFVSAANTITLRLANVSAGTITPGAVKFNVAIQHLSMVGNSGTAG